MSAQPRRQMSADQALERLEALCARAEMATGELADKLRRWGINHDDASRIIDSLRLRRFVDDGRFASAYVRDKVVFARWGRLKILRGLMSKRIDRDIINNALDEIDMATYTDNLRSLVQSKLAAHPELSRTYEGRTKIFRSLINHGYESSLASTILRDELGKMRS